MESLKAEMREKGTFKYAQADASDGTSSIRIGFRPHNKTDREWAIAQLRTAFGTEPVNPIESADSLIIYGQDESIKIMEALGDPAAVSLISHETQAAFRKAYEDNEK